MQPEKSGTEQNIFDVDAGKGRQDFESHGARGQIRPQHSKHHAISRVLDGIAIYAALRGAAFISSTVWEPHYDIAGLVALLLFSFFAEYNEVYYSGRGSRLHKEALRLVFSWACVAATLVAIAFFTKASEDFSRKVIGTWFVLAPSAMVLLYTTARLWLAFFGKKSRRAFAVVGANKLGQRLEQSLAEMPWMRFRFVGYFDDRAVSTDSKWRLPDSEVNICGGLEELYIDAKAGRIDVVYIALPMRAEQRIKHLVAKLADTTVSVIIIPDFFVFDLLHARWTTIQGMPAVSVYDSPHLFLDSFEKRMEDIIIGGAILAVIAIPMLFIAIGVKLTSVGPVFFKQRRYGVHGEEIDVWKFRSMKVMEDGDRVVQATKDDPRVTSFGAFLRRTSLDELPQFINVMKGTMSIVGPRPHAIAHNEYYRQQIQGYMLRHKVKPGITGLAQINGYRGETETMEKMAGRIRYDLEYIRRWSLWLDLKIIFVTIFKGFVSKTAY
ncbi:MAG: undecaprenyl-phosphate glucose phosphotransferase [Methylococcales bacterium]